jgi:hypothetical protein
VSAAACTRVTLRVVEKHLCNGAKKVNVAFGRSRPKYVDGKTVFHSDRFAMLPASS